MKTCKIVLQQIQDHFQATKTDNLFLKNPPAPMGVLAFGADSYVIPAFREEFQENGGAKGCLAQ